MKTLFALIFALTFTASVIAQTPAAAPAGSGKIGIVNPLLFTDAKAGAGITRLKAALQMVNGANKPQTDRMAADMTKYRALAAEIERLRTTAGTTQAALLAKATEAQALETTIKRTEEDYKRYSEKRYAATVSPNLNDIFKSMNENAKAKGYAVILNGPKLEEDDSLMGFEDR